MTGEDYRLIVFDMDGTLIRSFLREGAPREEYDRVELLPGVRDSLAQLHAEGIKLALATNQGGVAFGYQTEDQVYAKLARVCDALGVPLSLHVAFGHRHAKVAPYMAAEHVRKRKPSPIMLYEAMAAHGVGPGDTLFVGDHDTDRQAAHRAGCDYADVAEFFTHA